MRTGSKMNAIAVAGELLIIQKAASVAAIDDRVFRRDDLRAWIEDVRAPWMETAPIWRSREIGRFTRHRSGRFGIGRTVAAAEQECQRRGWKEAPAHARF